MHVLAAVCALLLAASVTPAMAQSSMNADEAYVRAVGVMKADFAKLQTQILTNKAVVDAKTSSLHGQLAAALSSLASLRDQARSENQTAKLALTAFAQGGGTGVQRGIETLVAAADAKPKTTVEQVRVAADEYLRAGRLAYATNLAKARDAYEMALRLAPDDPAVRIELATTYFRQVKTKPAFEQGRLLDAAYVILGEGMRRLGPSRAGESAESAAARDRMIYGQGFVLYCMGLRQAADTLIATAADRQMARQYFVDQGVQCAQH